MSPSSSPLPIWPGGGRPDEFAALFHGFHALILGLAYRRLGDYHLAQDAAQLTFIAAFRHLGSLRDPAAVRGWLCRIAVSQCGRVRRGDQRAEWVELDEACAAVPGPGDQFIQGELARLALRLLDELPQGQAEVLRRHYLGRESTLVIAHARHLPRTTVKKRLYDGRRSLRRHLDTYLGSGLLGCAAERGPNP